MHTHIHSFTLIIILFYCCRCFAARSHHRPPHVGLCIKSQTETTVFKSKSAVRARASAAKMFVAYLRKLNGREKVHCVVVPVPTRQATNSLYRLRLHLHSVRIIIVHTKRRREIRFAFPPAGLIYFFDKMHTHTHTHLLTWMINAKEEENHKLEQQSTEQKQRIFMWSLNVPIKK